MWQKTIRQFLAIVLNTESLTEADLIPDLVSDSGFLRKFLLVILESTGWSSAPGAEMGLGWVGILTLALNIA